MAAVLVTLIGAGVWLSGRETPAGSDFPDPFVLKVGGDFYAYGTENHEATVHIQVLRSRDLDSWDWLGDALPNPPEWAAGAFWGPSVLVIGDTYVLYYAAIQDLTGLHCIGTAVSADPDGPFRAHAEPLVCQPEHRGTIDPSPFVDLDGTAYLLWKTEGRFGGVGVEPPGEGDAPTLIWAQSLSADGRRLEGSPQRLLGPDRDWEGGIVEAPTMTRHHDGYVLVYSGNLWSTAEYAAGWAACTSPVGPCTKPDDGPLLTSSDGTFGPGGGELFTDAHGGLRLAYHAWGDPVGYPEGARRLHITSVRFDRSGPVVESGSEPVTVRHP